MSTLDPDLPVTEASVLAAITHANVERARISALAGVTIPLHTLPERLQRLDEPQTALEWESLDLCEALYRLMDRYGAGRVASVARTLAAMRGEG